MAMASPAFFFFVVMSCYGFLSHKVNGFEGRDHSINSRQLSHTHLQLDSLLPTSVCTHSEPDPKKVTSLKVVHKYGACNQHKKDASNDPTAADILLQDQSRVDFIHSRLLRVPDSSSTLPVESGSFLGTGNYVVMVGLGTPENEFSLVFDTGSDLTWTQCKPCADYCHEQEDPIFDPSQSSSYTNVSCSSSLCSQLVPATGILPGCAASTCIYGVQYGDQSYSIGFLAQEKLSLTETDVFDDFLFGCGQNNRGRFGQAAGILGLGFANISLVQQTAEKYGKVFSYCLPSTSSFTGHLTFGRESGVPVKYTPLSAVSLASNYYAIDIVGISLGGRQLSIPRSVFTVADSIIDSGTVITRLPPQAYNTLKSEFQRGMRDYPKAPPLSILDTCYNLTGYTTIKVPKISFFFNGGVTVELDPTGILYFGSRSQVCLAFAGNKDSTKLTIFGNVQQKTFEVVYDVAEGRIGFIPGRCK